MQVRPVARGACAVRAGHPVRRDVPDALRLPQFNWAGGRNPADEACFAIPGEEYSIVRDSENVE
jgi:hypothetical protein